MRAGTAESYQERVQRVLVHIQTNLDGALALEELAAVANFSPYHFHRVFRGLVGESVKEHVRRLRLERAAHRLRHSDMPVTEIAFEAGYESHEAFSRAFRTAFGDSPSEFRETRAPALFRRAEQPHEALEISARRMPAMRVAFARHVGAYDEVGEAWQRIMAWAMRAGAFGPQFRPLGIVHDDPEITPPQSLRYDAAIVVGEAAKPQGDIGVMELPEREYASAVHRGPYSTLYETYARICGEWVAPNGRELAAAPTVEVYRNNPQHTKPEELVTEIYMPLEQVG
jgi:AraC family transcriptional regulator